MLFAARGGSRRGFSPTQRHELEEDRPEPTDRARVSPACRDVLTHSTHTRERDATARYDKLS